ncbi:hypothetical protein [Chitinophaga sp.]|uniref:hypothetical protein n=1 Tax=Chitinophaga sp. TaxID=1869181 RepID=UPI0031CE2776
MQLIESNENLVNKLSAELSILDSRLFKLDIFEDANEGLVIDIYLNLSRSKAQREIKIRFLEIEEYSFFYSKSHYFYYVERFKLFKNNEGYYISLDPFNEENEIHFKDQDYVLCKSIQGYFI